MPYRQIVTATLSQKTVHIGIARIDRNNPSSLISVRVYRTQHKRQSISSVSTVQRITTFIYNSQPPFQPHVHCAISLCLTLSHQSRESGSTFIITSESFASRIDRLGDAYYRTQKNVQHLPLPSSSCRRSSASCASRPQTR